MIFASVWESGIIWAVRFFVWLSAIILLSKSMSSILRLRAVEIRFPVPKR